MRSFCQQIYSERSEDEGLGVLELAGLQRRYDAKHENKASLRNSCAIDSTLSGLSRSSWSSDWLRSWSFSI
ncbi:hypothetical protein EYF80_026971 [Liparis tanakae]|uniref:Uncharacterized protein n=1 Tax=Liparis tanakae TaxID=230148 RepID=A0A4Z2HBU6_9TELE|nr:hypothetical protein EYF80_026971 [Liparis tanakae]